MRYGFFDANGRIVSANNDDTVSELPNGAVALTDDQWDNRFALKLQSGQLVSIDPEYLLSVSELKSNRVEALSNAYQNAIAQPVSFMTQGGVTQTYQVGPKTISSLQLLLNAFSAANSTPVGFYWVAEDNTQVPFTFADLQGLMAAIGAQQWNAFKRLQLRKASIAAAPNAASAKSVKW